MSSITTAQLAIYAALAIPVLFLLVKHGSPGLLGWGYLFAFCCLRIIGGGLFIKGSDSATIVANIGLSPLLLSASGILHESNTLKALTNPKIEWILVIVYHFVVAAATGILAAGASSLQGDDPMPGDLNKVKAGIAILTVAWAALVAWSITSLVMSKKRTHQATSASHAGSQILAAVMAALIFIGIRVVYTLVAFVTQDKSLSPTDGSLAVRVVLSLLTELIATLIFIAGGIVTMNARQQAKSQSSDESWKPVKNCQPRKTRRY